MRSIAVCLALAIPASAGAGVVYDAADDFSSAMNPNGVWSYGFGGSSTGAMSLLLESQQRFEPAQMPGWSRDADASSFALPAVFRNTSGGAVPVIDYPAPVAAGALVVHPGDLSDEDFVFVRFTALVSSDYEVGAMFSALDTTAGAQTLVIVNSASVLFDDTIVGFGDSSAYASVSSVSLGIGDTIDFIVGAGASFTNDSVQLHAAVTQIPAPACALVLAMCSGAFARRQR